MYCQRKSPWIIPWRTRTRGIPAPIHDHHTTQHITCYCRQEAAAKGNWQSTSGSKCIHLPLLFKMLGQKSLQTCTPAKLREGGNHKELLSADGHHSRFHIPPPRLDARPASHSSWATGGMPARPHELLLVSPSACTSEHGRNEAFKPTQPALYFLTNLLRVMGQTDIGQTRNYCGHVSPCSSFASACVALVQSRETVTRYARGGWQQGRTCHASSQPVSFLSVCVPTYRRPDGATL